MSGAGPDTEWPSMNPVPLMVSRIARCLMCHWATDEPDGVDAAREHTRRTCHPCVCGPRPMWWFSPDVPEGRYRYPPTRDEWPVNRGNAARWA